MSFDLFRFTAPAALFALLIAIERARPLRRVAHARGQRIAVNLGFALTSGVVFAPGYAFVVLPLVAWAASAGIGLLRWVSLPPAVRVAASIVLLDYTLWIWHRLNHSVPWLWRFHVAHHADVELDASTALRFHFGEMLLSVPYRAAQAVLIGVDATTLLAWEAALILFVEFHHSNVRLPLGFERVLRFILITPRVHGIHHATEPPASRSNFGTILAAWDWLHGRHFWGVSQDAITIGVREIRDAQPLGRALALPFAREVPRAPNG